MLRPLLALVTLVLVATSAAVLPAAAGERPQPGPSVHAHGDDRLELRRAPRVVGVARIGKTLRVRPATWKGEPDTVRYRWLRDGEPIRGATGKRRKLTVADFGHGVAVRVTARKAGHAPVRVIASATRRVDHRVRAKRTVTYHVETRGRVVADLRRFRTQAQQTLDDPRGWRGAGVKFRRVARGGDLTLVLSEASRLPSFSPVCSVEWSCRVGRYVVINQTRWLHASPMWNRRSRSLRDYRHMVVNHEMGHWLGHGHRGCPRRGAAAPVMQTQSKGLDGCRPNPWPTPSERRLPRFG
ncbi:DUF3152 domain-containing protein [Nocardioides caldifontis]|uniref:DUF3152 domain-containing protein n=1 Tax=Nocardioides caldifontis TaxID=2588938 RepID=UPI0011DFB205|nr:DUF3152 domain-containing protein [Nocardioides caldifontis]